MAVGCKKSDRIESIIKCSYSGSQSDEILSLSGERGQGTGNGEQGRKIMARASFVIFFSESDQANFKVIFFKQESISYKN
jgi:hypothetical protein